MAAVIQGIRVRVDELIEPIRWKMDGGYGSSYDVCRGCGVIKGTACKAECLFLELGSLVDGLISELIALQARLAPAKPVAGRPWTDQGIE